MVARGERTLTKLAAGGFLSSGINRLAAERTGAEPVEDEVIVAQPVTEDTAE
jgi:hypothetical protein